MQVTRFDVPDVMLIEPKVHVDDRGYFTERYKRSAFHDIGLTNEFIQDNYSVSRPGILRGLHYQWEKPQGKLVTCVQGKILDVAVDVRANSPTFGKYVSAELSGDKPQWLWVPAGFAHGFCVIGGASAHVMYKVDNDYNPKGEGGIRWDDKDLRIDWPKVDYFVHPKDSVLQTFSEYSKAPVFT